MRRCAPLLLAVLGHAAWAQGVVGSKHDLSITGTGPVRAVDETRVCIFCHVSHRGGPRGVNRPESSATYWVYDSTTLDATVDARPTGASQICLSCHDGTIALGHTLASGDIPLTGTGAGGTLGTAARLGTDLRGTHPVSFLPLTTATSHPPASGSAPALDASGAVQCTACHDPHREWVDPSRGKFLVGSNRQSALCTACHDMPGWDANPGAHRSSARPYTAAQGAITPYGTVGENACESCHDSHSASVTATRLLRIPSGEGEDRVCLGCHDGAVATQNIAVDRAKTYAHARREAGLSNHDASEGPGVSGYVLPETSATAPRHVACVDCHDGHAAHSRDTVAPLVTGALAQVWGIDLDGRKVAPARYEFEVCFKCHGDSANKPATLPPSGYWPVRESPDRNLRRVFGLDASSQHAVTAAGRGDVPSLLPAWQGTRQIRCSDCHASDRRATSPTAPRGPHGSIHPALLERNLSTADNTVESATAYALCYKCHDRAILLSSQSAFPEHRKHVVGEQTPCTGCHAAHGVSATAGDPAGHVRLIDFDTRFVFRTSGGIRQYRSLGYRRGRCTLVCHGDTHSPEEY